MTGGDYIIKIKVSFFDLTIIKTFFTIVGVVSAFVTIWSVFGSIAENNKELYLKIAFGVASVIYVSLWIHANILTQRTLNINGSKVIIKVGDIFKEKGLRTIAFNEYFDTIVDNEIIAESTLNGKFIKNGYYNSKECEISPSEFNDILLSNRNISDYKKGFNRKRERGNKQKFLLGTSIVYENYLITAMTKFDYKNRAYLTQKDFIDFLLNFWDQVDILYNGRTVVIPLLGSGITRFYEKIDIPDQELLNIIIWTFKVSRKKFAYDSKLVIVIHNSKQDYINFYKLKKLERI